jgi:hypothetical protein
MLAGVKSRLTGTEYIMTLIWGAQLRLHRRKYFNQVQQNGQSHLCPFLKVEKKVS